MENVITNILCITNKNQLPSELTKIILNKAFTPSYHKLIQYNDELISELSIDFIEHIRIICNFNEDFQYSYCVLLKNTDLILPVINYMNCDNYIQSVEVLEKLKYNWNIHFTKKNSEVYF